MFVSQPGTRFWAILQEPEDVLLLRRLDALERLVFGRSRPAAGAAAGMIREVQPLTVKIEAISKAIARAEGGGQDFQDLARKGAIVCTGGGACANNGIHERFRLSGHRPTR